MFDRRFDTDDEREPSRRALEPAPVASHAAVLALQRSAGNQAVARMISGRPPVIARTLAVRPNLTSRFVAGGTVTPATLRDAHAYVSRAWNDLAADEIQLSFLEKHDREVIRLWQDTFAAEMASLLQQVLQHHPNQHPDAVAMALSEVRTGGPMNGPLVAPFRTVVNLLEDALGAVAAAWDEWNANERKREREQQRAAKSDQQAATFAYSEATEKSKAQVRAPQAPQAPTYQIASIKKTGFKTRLTKSQAKTLISLWEAQLTIADLDLGRKHSEVLKAPYGKVLRDAAVRLDGEDIEADARYQVYRVQGSNNAVYPVLGGVYVQLGVKFTPEALREAFSMALQLAHEDQYAVLYDGGTYRAPGA